MTERCDELAAFYESCESIGKILQGCHMEVLAESGCAVGKKKHAKIPDKGIPSRRLAAEIGHHSSDDQITDVSISQSLLKNCLMEGAVCGFWDDSVFFSYVKLRQEAGITASFDDEFGPPLPEQTMILIWLMLVLGEKQRNVSLSCRCDDFNDIFQNGSDDLTEILLKVDQKDGCLTFFRYPMVRIPLTDGLACDLHAFPPLGKLYFNGLRIIMLSAADWTLCLEK